MRPEFYEDPSWPAPNLQYMMKEGAYAVHVRPVFPTVTLPNHTAMITGALPARSGYISIVRSSR
ncbi:alkaline phosphatase family protein [Puia sp. P3]|uniref:alkaline phosphatase family protein n=1 Tax=Puia sp. P3 TaxID=3423952 RepID=UPI003D67797F